MEVSVWFQLTILHSCSLANRLSHTKGNRFQFIASCDAFYYKLIRLQCPSVENSNSTNNRGEKQWSISTENGVYMCKIFFFGVVLAIAFRTTPQMNNEHTNASYLKFKQICTNTTITEYFNLTAFIIKINQYFHYKVFILKPQRSFVWLLSNKVCIRKMNQSMHRKPYSSK